MATKPQTSDEGSSVDGDPPSVHMCTEGVSTSRTVGVDGGAKHSDHVDSKRNRIRPIDGHKYIYDMGHPNRGMFIIINNKTFLPETKMLVRTGTDLDAEALYQLFEELGFNVSLYNNLTSAQMLKVMITAANPMNHINVDCFGCAILSHGEEGVVYGTDSKIPITNLVDPFKGNKCPSLLGKPKLFFIQAGRGGEFDDGKMLEADASEDVKVHMIPREADCLYAYSTVAGYYSWSNRNQGSWFIQSLCRILKEYAYSKDLMWILTKVNYEVAYKYQSRNRDAALNAKKQVSSIVSMLTKEITFLKK